MRQKCWRRCATSNDMERFLSLFSLYFMGFFVVFLIGGLLEDGVSSRTFWQQFWQGRFKWFLIGLPLFLAWECHVNGRCFPLRGISTKPSEFEIRAEEYERYCVPLLRYWNYRDEGMPPPLPAYEKVRKEGCPTSEYDKK